MSDYLKAIDKSANMEALRTARSYNDVVVVLSRIKSAASSIYTRIGRSFLKKPEAVKIDIKKSKNISSLDRKTMRRISDDLDTLNCSRYELQFAKSLTDIIAGKDKLDRFHKLATSTLDSVTQAENLVLKYVNSISSKIEPRPLRELAQTVEKVLSKSVSYGKLSTFVIPGHEEGSGFSRYAVLHDAKSSNGFIVPEFIVCLHAEPFGDNHALSVSFPSRIRERAHKTPVSSARDVSAALRKEIAATLGLDISSKPDEKLETLDGVVSSDVRNGFLDVELEPGLTGSQINHILTKMLETLHEALGVQDSRSDIVHRVVAGPKGNKIVRVRLLDRNFYDMAAFLKLKKMLPLGGKALKEIRSIAGK